MAKIIEITNPLTGQPQEVIQSDFTAQQIDDAVATVLGGGGGVEIVNSFNGRTGTVVPQAGDYTAEDVGAAPEGYGLGSFGKAISSTENLNDFINNGWYAFGVAPLNAPTLEQDGWTAGYSYMLVLSRNSDVVTQIIFSTNVSSVFGCMIKRYKVDGSWSPWEWINPPMVIGVEYRTTDRLDGKPVYAKLVDCGNMPNKTSKTVSNVFTDMKDICLLVGSMRTGSAGGFLAVNDQVLVNNNATSIQITTTEDYSAWALRVLVKYTKTTD